MVREAMNVKRVFRRGWLGPEMICKSQRDTMFIDTEQSNEFPAAVYGGKRSGVAPKGATVLERRRAFYKYFAATRLLGVALLLFFALKSVTLANPTDQTWIHDRYVKGDFSLVRQSQAADILVSSDDFKVVQIAAQNFAEDVERVTGKKPALSSDASHLSRYAVIVGTLGKSPFIDSLVHSGKLNLEQLRGQWESFVIATVPLPLPNVEMGLVIVGSDRRG